LGQKSLAPVRSAGFVSSEPGDQGNGGRRHGDADCHLQRGHDSSLPAALTISTTQTSMTQNLVNAMTRIRSLDGTNQPCMDWDFLLLNEVD
jgi:hypothetical protein